MKKKTIVIIAVVVAAIAAVGIYVLIRLSSHMTDIIGVTTLSDRNTVMMNAKQDSTFVSGQGYLTVGDGGKLHVEYKLTAGSVDIAFHAGGMDISFSPDSVSLTMDEDSGSVTVDEDSVPYSLNENGTGPEVFQNADLGNLTAEGEIFGASGVTGTGSLDFDAAPGEYVVYFARHDAVGTATVTAPEQ